jgi:hypothetical protein
MRAVQPSHLPSLREGLSLLRRHPLLTLGLTLLAMLLSQMGPALELAAKAGPSLLFQSLFGAVGLLPLEMYFFPRFQARLDAELLNPPQNRFEAWTHTFDARWLLAFGVRMIVSVMVGVGMVLFILPGIILLTIFGWAPLRILLRGDSLVDAFRWSQSAMARHWPRVVQAVLAMVMLLLVYQGVSGYVLTRFLPNLDPQLGADAWLRLRHPAFWILGFTGGFLNLWLTAALLALFHRLEAAVQTPDGPR